MQKLSDDTLYFTRSFTSRPKRLKSQHINCTSQRRDVDTKGLLLMMMSCVTSLSMVILLTIQGVRGEEWSVTYQPKSICRFVGSSVDMSCSYTNPSDLTITEVYWTKHNYRDSPPLRDDPDYRDRISEGCEQGTTRCNLRIKSLTTSDIGEYYCRITTSIQGQKLIGTPGIFLEVIDPPQTSVSISPPGDIHEGTEVTLTCTSTSDLPVKSYSWSKSGHRDLGTEKKYTIKHFRPEDSGWYDCRSLYECGFRDSSTVYLQVNNSGSTTSPSTSLPVLYPPKNTRIESDPSGEMIEGSTVTLTCMSEADPPVHTYTWIKKSGAVQLKSGKEKTLIFNKIRSEDRGEYLCQAANRIGQQDSPAVSLQVIYTLKNTTVLTRPSGVITKGSSVNLNCSSDANPPVEIYTWFKVGESTPVGSGQQYSITNIRSEDGGQYYCEARNKYGAGKSSIVSVKVEGDQSSVLIPVVAVSVCGLVCLLCAFVGVKKMRRRKKPEEQDHQCSSIKLQSRGGAEDDVQYSTNQPHGSRETAGDQGDSKKQLDQNDVQYSTIQPHGSRETAGAQGDDVQYASVQFQKAGAAHGSPDQPEGELSVIYSTVETRAEGSSSKPAGGLGEEQSITNYTHSR